MLEEVFTVEQLAQEVRLALDRLPSSIVSDQARAALNELENRAQRDTDFCKVCHAAAVEEGRASVGIPADYADSAE